MSSYINRILVTGGSGFIGANFIINQLSSTENVILNLDKLTYASSPNSLRLVESNPNYKFIKGDISDNNLVSKIIFDFKPTYLVNFAAESHVDNSIKNPKTFIDTNVLGVFNLLFQSNKYFKQLSPVKKEKFKFIHISTDEVYGSLNKGDVSFTELNRYNPSSPYSASKASSDHLVLSWFKTYNFPTIVTNCSNNYGPLQFPEKLVPMVILNCLSETKIPIYGDGSNIRDWIHVNDHCDAIYRILLKGKIGEQYNIGSNNEVKNIEIVKYICKILDSKIKRNNNLKYFDLIEYVEDRAGHDFRYSIDNTKIKEHTGWAPRISFNEGLVNTVDWYINNQNWWKNI
ncbi:MAG: dTDP-glucose 4,6-dehydratase [Candidatus Marinimicrobia bacterium]|nr:dTDP-glucose 4,6-dehydratase [Candidatus Neomarinimicrobiota bacterium]|tara:strand:+ start:18375 stop:19406 length:1032 start_codon:yes stop_codon:yes gene_type:complete